MKRFAIILSCEEYNNKRNYADVAFADRDAQLLYDTLTNYCDYAKQDVYLEQLTMFDKERTPDAILVEIKELISKAKAGDSVLFYFAGHGDYDGSESYLVFPYTKREELSTTALPIRDIRNILKNNELLNISVLDCCHSGYDARSSSEGKFSWIDEIESYGGNGWITFAACEENGYSYPDKDLQQGIFTYYFAETIKEFEEGEYIAPEIFKLKLFDKVRAHCENKNIQQIPTYNSSIVGNVSIAQRKNKIIDISESEDNKVDIDDCFEHIKSRLNEIRGNVLSTSDNGLIKLKEIASLCYENVQNNISNIKSYDCKIEVAGVKSINYIDESIRRSIVKFINGKKYITVHDIRIDRIYEEDKKPTPVGFMPQLTRLQRSMFGYEEDKPKLKKIEYIMNQESNMPESYISIEIDNDEYMPEGELFIYICPLKIKAVILFGIKINDNSQISNHVYIDINNVNDKLIEESVIHTMEIFNKKYYDALIKEIDYLEWEKSL